jgi:hypothetical protein
MLIRPIKLHYLKTKKSDSSTGIRESPSSQFLQLAPYVFQTALSAGYALIKLTALQTCSRHSFAIQKWSLSV